MHHRQHHKQAAAAQTGVTGLTTNTQSADTSCGTEQNGHQVSVDDIRLCAYRKWKNAGMPSGDGAQFWLDAEHELAQGK